MKKIIECVPNFSEGRDQKKIKAIVDAGRVKGVKILDIESDSDHNRMLATIVGGPEAVLESAWQMIVKAVELIDMEKHKGEHPRIGAADVVPFIPVHGVTMNDCVELAKELAERVADKLQIPVYLYEEAAVQADRRNLADVRRGEYEGLKKEIGVNPDRKPDFGPVKMHSTAGATVIGARKFLIAFNVNLATTNVDVAKKIARIVREKDGGFPAVKALGFEIKKRRCVQVSMNLCDYQKTNLDQVYQKIEQEAEKRGVKVLDSEVYGLLPLQALVQSFGRMISDCKFSRKQVLETRIWE